MDPLAPVGQERTGQQVSGASKRLLALTAPRQRVDEVDRDHVADWVGDIEQLVGALEQARPFERRLPDDRVGRGAQALDRKRITGLRTLEPVGGDAGRRPARGSERVGCLEMQRVSHVGRDRRDHGLPNEIVPEARADVVVLQQPRLGRALDRCNETGHRPSEEDREILDRERAAEDRRHAHQLGGFLVEPQHAPDDDLGTRRDRGAEIDADAVGALDQRVALDQGGHRLAHEERVAGRAPQRTHQVVGRGTASQVGQQFAAARHHRAQRA